ncbi:hypothetical protein CRI94_13460 [Longibacter salinarum]|uniref:L,D-transpeptidase scaffold domain-containing protein n=1 Tax=Longibacter salinarum TaxID=1850348 RepID=A0A2A8CUT8_9BACT|nr:hypothetical protein CRI94_13460 [Longibacter salinarum]
MRSILLFFVAVILLTAGCNQGEGASATDDTDAPPAAADSVVEEPSRPDSTLRLVADGVRMRIESEAQGLDAMPTADAARSRSIMQWYEETSFRPLWVDSSGPRGIVDQLVVALRHADDQGLSPADYPADRIESLA